MQISQGLDDSDHAAPVWCGRSWEALVTRRQRAFEQALALQHATEEDGVGVVTRFLEWAESSGVDLMRDEEEWIFWTLRPTPAPVIKALEEHIEISTLIESLLQEVQVGCVDLRLVHRLGGLLEAHLLDEEENVRPLATPPPRLTLAR